MAGGLIIWAFQTPVSPTTAPAPPPGDIGRASLLLLILAVLLGVLLLAIALLTVIRRLRRRAAGQTVKPARPLADPWQESANRVRVNPQRQRPADFDVDPEGDD